MNAILSDLISKSRKYEKTGLKSTKDRGEKSTIWCRQKNMVMLHFGRKTEADFYSKVLQIWLWKRMADRELWVVDVDRLSFRWWR